MMNILTHNWHTGTNPHDKACVLTPYGTLIADCNVLVNNRTEEYCNQYAKVISYTPDLLRLVYRLAKEKDGNLKLINEAKCLIEKIMLENKN